MADLVQLEGHANAGLDDQVQEVHVGEHPFVLGVDDAHVSLEESMHAIQERIHTGQTEGGQRLDISVHVQKLTHLIEKQR